MLYKPNSFTIKPDSPWADDKLERKKVADYLTRVLASATQPFVIGLDSPYGTGKSFFLKNWQCDLELQGFHTVYFNAWETDFSQNALFAFMAAIKRELEVKLPKDKKAKLKKALSQFPKKTAGFLRHHALPLVAKGITRKFLDIETAKEAIELIGIEEKDLTSLSEKLAKEGLKSQEAAENSMENFRGYLKKIVNDLTDKESNPTKKKLIIFVDELDRCRPDYAVQILECIKHLFAVDGMLFVLAIDEKQVRNAIHSVYGPGLDSEGYLRRFIDWRYRLSLPPYFAFCNFLAKRFELESLPSLSNEKYLHKFESLINNFSDFARMYTFSLRQMEQCFTEINLVLRTLKAGDFPHTFALGIFIVLYHARRLELYACARGRLSISELVKSFHEKDLIFPRSFKKWSEFERVFNLWILTPHKLNRLYGEIENKKNTPGIRNRDKELFEKELGEIEQLIESLPGPYSLAETILNRIVLAHQYVNSP